MKRCEPVQNGSKHCCLWRTMMAEATMTTWCRHSKVFPPMSHLAMSQGYGTLRRVVLRLTSVASASEQVLC
jgi:hypothetical protein